MMKRLFLLATAVAIAITGSVSGQEDDHDHDHDHEHEHGDEHGLELKMLFRGSSDPLKLIWTKAALFDHPKIVSISAGDGITCGEEELEIAEEHALEKLEEAEEGLLTPTECEPAQTIFLDSLAELHGSSSGVAFYLVETSPTNCTAIFSTMTREELGLHFVNQTSGTLAEVAFEHSPVEVQNSVSAIAGIAIGGAIVVSIIPIAVIVMCLPLGFLKYNKNIHFVIHFMNAFGCGALISVVALHLYPEMAVGLHEAGEPFWKGGALVLTGICAVAAIHVIADSLSGRKHDPEMGLTGHKTIDNNQSDIVAKEVEEGTKEHSQSLDDSSAASRVIRWGTLYDIVDVKNIHPLVWSLTIGDAMHNFVDGTIIATAFIACGSSAGWTTVGATIAHEVPQELGDFSLMLSVGATVGQAVVFNLISQMFAILGCGIVLAVGSEIPESQTGLLLAFGIGIFLFISLTDIMPLVLEVRQWKEKLAAVAGLILAFTAIGLSTLGESECGHKH